MYMYCCFNTFSTATYRCMPHKSPCLTRVLYVNRAKKGGVRTCVNSCVKVFSMALNWLEQ